MKMIPVTASVVRFEVSSTDGWTDWRVCVDGRVHARLGCERYTPDSVCDVSDCDGSCRPEGRQMDLRVVVAALARESKNRDDVIVPCPLEITPDVQALLDAEGPVMGALYDRGYCKRNSEWQTFCLGSLHVHVSTGFDWAYDRSKTYSHEVRGMPCDGSCRGIPVSLPRRLRRAIGRDDADVALEDATERATQAAEHSQPME